MRNIEKAPIYYVKPNESKMGYTIVKREDYADVLTFWHSRYLHEKILLPATMPETIHIPYTNAYPVIKKIGEYDYEVVTLGRVKLANGECLFIYPDGEPRFLAKSADESMNDTVFTAMAYFGAAMRFGGIR